MAASVDPPLDLPLTLPSNFSRENVTFTTPGPWTLDMNLTRDRCPPGKEMEYKEVPSNIFENISCPFEMKDFPAWEMGLKIAVYVVAIFMAVVGNLLVLIVIAFNKRMHTRTYFYIANLAMSDLMIGGFNMWIHLGTNITNDWPFGPLLCKLFPFIQVVALTASTGCMTVIAGERFFATVYPMKAKFSQVYKHVIIVVVVWLIAVGVATPMLFVRRMSELVWADRDQMWCEEVWPRYVTGVDPDPEFICSYKYPERRAYYTCQVVIMYLLPIGLTSVAYGFIAYTLRKRQAPGHPTDQVLERQQQTKRKVMRMLMVVFAVFVICWTPQEVIVLLDANQPKQSNQHIPSGLRFAAIYIAFFNSSLNPILYAGLNEKCRRACWELFRCKGQKVAPGAVGALRKPRPSNGACNNVSPGGGGAQGYKKSLALLPSSYNPRLPPIKEDQCETWSNCRGRTGECDKATDTRCDGLRRGSYGDDSALPSPLSLHIDPDALRRQDSASSSGSSGVTKNLTMTTIITRSGSSSEEALGL